MDNDFGAIDDPSGYFGAVDDPSVSSAFNRMKSAAISAGHVLGPMAEKYGPSVAGSLIAGAATGGMGLPASIAGQALGAGAGEAYRQLIQRARGKEVPRTSTEAAKEIAKVGGGAAAAEVGLGLAGKAAKAIGPSAAKVGAQFLRAGPGIPEKYGEAALKDIGTLAKSPSKESVQAAYQAFEKYTGLKGLSDQIWQRGEEFSSPELQRLVYGAGKKLEAGEQLTPQELYTASQAANKLQLFAKYGEPQAKSAVESGLVDKAGKLADDALEKQLPEYKPLRSDYFKRKVAEQFESILPLNKNQSPNVLRTLSALGAAGAGVSAGVPAAMLAPLAISPAVAGLAIRGANVASKVLPKAIPAGAAALMSNAARKSGFTLGQQLPPDQLEALQSMRRRAGQ